MEQKGVSPVVGTILLIAITVALAAIVAMLVSGLGGRGAPPSARLTVTAANTDPTSVMITISHEGGDDLIISDLEVQASDSTGVMHTVSMTTSGGGTTLTVGGKATGTYTYGAGPGGKVITVYVVHNPSKQKLFSNTRVIVAATHVSLAWNQTTWTGGPTTPELQVGTWDDTYGNYYVGENENNAGGELKLSQLLDGWTRRKPITISNTGSALADYQISVTVDTASLISAGKMQASGADIRFVGPTLADNFEYGAENVFSSKNSEWGSMSSVALDSSHALIAYRNASGYGAAVIATISGTGAAATVSFGSEYPFNQASTRGCVTVALSQTKVFIAYVDEGNSNKGTAIVATVSGSTITYGSEYLFNDAVSDFLDAAWIGENVLITYQDTGNSNKGTATVATVSGSTITYGSEYLFNDAETWVSGVDTLSTNKALITCTAFAGEWFCTAKVATVTGLTVSFGSGTIYDYSPGGGGSPVALSPTRVVVLYGFEDNDFQNNLVPLTISGTTVIAGVRYTFSSHGEEMNTRVWGLDESHFFAIYLDSDNNYFGTSSIGTVLGSGASANVTLGPKRVIGDTYTSSAAVFDPSHALISYSGVNGPGIAFVATRSEVTAELSHWIEPGTINTASTKIWVRVPSIPAGSSTIYMYYGNPSATSDGAQLKGIWHFDEGSETTTYDNSGNGNNGTLVNGPTWTSGKIESAVNFDGTDDYVSVPDADSLDFTTAMTVMAWVKLDDITADHWVASKSGYVDGEFATWRIGYISWSGFVFLFREWDGVVSSTTFPTTGTWYHIAATYDGSHTKIYVNGVLEGTLAYSTPIEVTDYPLYIGSGSWAETPELFFDGTIDEVRVYDRALSAVEISDIYNMTFIRVLDNTNAIWHLDEVSGTTAYDSSGNNHNGTLLPSGSGPTWTSGEFANALSFDGIDDYDNVGDLGARPIKGTISYWMKSDAVVSSRNTMSTGGAGNIGFRFEQATGGGFVVAIGNDGGSFTGHPYSTSLQASIWYHVVLTWDSSQSKVWGYLNGVQKFADSQSLWATNLAQVKLGVGFGSRWFDGILDEVAIWNRDLSAGEVLDLYNNYGYTTTNYLGRVLVRKYTSPEPTTSVGGETSLYYSTAYIESSIYDAGSTFDWTTVSWSENKPSGTNIVMKVRTGSDNDPYPDDTENWSGWCVHGNNTENTSLPNNRYAQYRVEMTTTDNSLTPKLYDITLNYL
jgi:flagellin-like protein